METDLALENAKEKVSELTGAYPLNSKAIIEAQVSIEGLEDGLKRLKALKTDLFGA